MKNPSKMVTFRLRPEILLKIDLKAREMNLKRSQFLKKALKNLIGE